jgi:murein DD-endopeptidase MepM/ murein hydrolase activator NlpD
MRWSKFGAAALVVALLLWYSLFSPQDTPLNGSHSSTLNIAPTFRFGFNLDSFDIEEFTIAPGLILGDLLVNSGVTYPAIDALVKVAGDTYPFRKLRAGKNCAFVRKAGHGAIECVVYEPDPYRYVRYHIGDSIGVEVVERKIERCIEMSAGIVTSSLWSAMESTGHSWELIDLMENALAWSVDFHHVQKHDEFRLVYEQNYVRGEPVGIGKLLGAYFKSGAKEYYSIWFDSGDYQGYYDLEGRPMKSAFLKAPVKYSRISSRFSHSRFHPILKQHRGHFGTDYAAPYGTPIVAVADGIVTIAGYTSGNGNYVKIRHNEVYETQYLHMQKFAAGIKAGTPVKQNDVIGYVGSTGLATVPRVCFRFWKHGKQVDHLRENLPNPEPMRAEHFPVFERVRSEIVPQLRTSSVASVTVKPTP